MFKEVLLITPKLSSSDLNNMERSLQSRFTKVAKGFGKGLLGVLGGAGVVGLVGGAIGGAISGIYDRLVAPLKETQSAIDRTLKNADDISTNAKAFGSSTGELARLQAFGEATGLQAGDLTTLVQKFQSAVAEAEADPNKSSAVRQYVGTTNSVAGFFEFIQALNGMSKNDQLLVQGQVFGEKQIKKMADLLQNAGKIAEGFGGPSADRLTKAIDPLADQNDKVDRVAALRKLEDFEKKSQLITDDVIAQNEKQKAFELKRENDRLATFSKLASIALTADEINAKIDKAVFHLIDIAGKMGSLTASARGIQGSPVVRLPGKRTGEM